MMNEYALNSSIAFLALAASMLGAEQSHALSLSPATKPVLEKTVLKSSLPAHLKGAKQLKIIPAAYQRRAKSSAKKSSITTLKGTLKKNNFSEIYFTKKSGAILEAEACKNNKRYFLQIAPDGQLLQATQFDHCISPKIKKNVRAAPENKEAAVSIPLSRPDQTKKTPISLAPAKPKKNIQRKKPIALTKILSEQGYEHIYAPKNRKLGVMACKKGVEYAFNVTRPTVTSWQQMISQRKALGKCFGYGKQILSLNDLLKIMYRHGDTQIRVVSGNLPMFEAYSCHKGQRRHVKINRWGNDNIRPAGKCS